MGLSALKWFQEAAERLSEGFIVIIDYGHRAETLLSELYPRGTLLAYRGHRTHTDFYSEPGLDDLTAQQRLKVEHAQFPLWDAPIFFIVFLLAICGEWMYRKRHRLL